MNIYVSHSNNFDFKKELYLPLKNSNLKKKHTFIFPHDQSIKPFNSRSLIQAKKCDLILAEVSYPSTGQGIELGWANLSNIPIICIYKAGSKISRSLKSVSDRFIEYRNTKDLKEKAKEILNYKFNS